jgi:hypothetical protein
MVMLGLGAGCVLFAADEPLEKVQVSKTETIDFPSRGTLRLKNSIGVLTVEGWDRPEVEMTTIKSSKVAYPAREREKAAHDLDRVQVSAQRKGDELVITTDFPRHRPFPLPNPVGGATNFDLEYRIKVPRTARLIVDHDVGEVNVDDLTGNIEVKLLQGEIMLHLPEETRYAINAKSDFGNVRSDFPGDEKRRRWWPVGHRVLNEDSGSAHTLNLMVGYGDVIILKTRVPKAPESLIQPPKTDRQ